MSEPSEQMKKIVKDLFRNYPELTTTEVIRKSGIPLGMVYPTLNEMEKGGLVKRQALSGGKWTSLIFKPDEVATMMVGKKGEGFSGDPRIPSGVTFLDWNNVMPQLMKAYEHKIFPLCIGPKGTGKTESIRKLAEIEGIPIEMINLSLRAREHHLIGRLDTNPDGTIGFKTERFAKSMEEGIIVNLDEMNAAEPDMLLRFDEALDHRRELRVEDRVIKAKPSWFCVASINPLNHAGTKELPPQLISRFPIRIYFPFPDTDNEVQVIRSHCPNLKGEQVATLKKLVEAVQQLRTQDLPYTPSMRETVTMGTLLESGVSVKDIVMWCIVNVYHQYDDSIVDRVKELLISRGISL